MLYILFSFFLFYIQKEKNYNGEWEERKRRARQANDVDNVPCSRAPSSNNKAVWVKIVRLRLCFDMA